MESRIYSRIRDGSLSREEAAQQLKMIGEAYSAAAGGDSQLIEAVQRLLSMLICDLLKIVEESFDGQNELSEYGFDSVSFTLLANRINDEYGLQLSPTLFFEQTNLDSLVQYLVQEHRVKLTAKHITGAGNAVSPENPAKLQDKPEKNLTDCSVSLKPGSARFLQEEMLAGQASPPMSRDSAAKRAGRHETSPQLRTQATVQQEPIAIIGMSGRFPMADNLEQFWDNLVSGKDCISEIPKDRWDWREIYGDPLTEVNKTNVKWGGFIEGVDEFDPAFFGIVPHEAELMDPQQRLLMMYVWKALEDAGYAASSIAGTDTAIFVGTAGSGYSNLVSRAGLPIEGYTFSGIVPSMGPNRMSYFLDIHGPSEPVETACSSSLIAIHRAVCALENGSCSMAIVGGVNTLIAPDAHIGFNKAGMLAQDGRCKTFSSAANGYVRGEGIGMLVLKRLRAAEQAGDSIYAVIRSSAENHGGRANSLTAPNPNAQAALLQTAYRRAGIDPRTVGYIEAHGTGTELGDPIEINGLKAAFKALYEETGDPHIREAHCGLGSVKSNIGHLELAAGIAGVIKTVLQLKHQTLVKSLHCDPVNSHIRLENTPFYIVRETVEWKAPEDEHGHLLPRRAGVSSFGFGGANAHVVIEEYRDERPSDTEQHFAACNPLLFVWSAKTEDRLLAIVQQWLAEIRAQRFDERELADIAYTLQTGREALEERLAFTAGSLQELEFKLEGFMQGRTDIFRGRANRGHETATLFKDEDMRQVLEIWMAKGKYSQLLDLWVKGVTLDWSRLYTGAQPRRRSLPTYPFAPERYWVADLSAPLTTLLTRIRPQHSITEEAALAVADNSDEDDISPLIANIVAAATGYLAAEISFDRPLAQLSSDSIVIMKIVRAIATSFHEWNTPEAGNELLKLFLEEEITVRRLAGHIWNKRRVSRAAALPECWDQKTIQAVYGGQKEIAQNLLCDKVRITSDDPFTMTGTLIVDETHPFFFDHPLDHISGLQLAEAMGQLAKTGQLLRLGLDPKEPVFVYEAQLAFHDYCHKANKAVVHAVAPPAGGAEVDLGCYKTEIIQEGRLVASGTYKIKHLLPPERDAASSWTHDTSLSLPVSKELVNKRLHINVMISGAESSKDRESLECRLCIDPENPYFSDFPGVWHDTVVLLEACRQSLRVFGYAQNGSDQRPLSGLLPVLKTMNIKLTRPILRTAEVVLHSERHEAFQVGDNHMLQLQGLIMSDGAKAGSYEIQSLLLAEEFLAGLREGQLREAASPPTKKKKSQKQAPADVKDLEATTAGQPPEQEILQK
ncbi:beta-ketoacyl synthase N-terminal-like domain-containing protein [Paenibacillus sp. A3M_27_13]|uniref:beta-ketoacyl synthase N-terminal-like domain-containing protein n=1 Tax=Paenibacillus sp. A3M_27_13 TaxID=2962029 RepID=UPI0020B8A250|nr:beta-ketoacyl synthase N-terminal-like domain-containing protein [Paenibacillus sp. A3M_27_13]MCP3746818.1 phosphopantetheine-binding protein [Paenibacillus sp. A3M_27_13]